MTATLLHILAALLLAFTSPREAWLRYRIWELEHWLADIRRDFEHNGMPDSEHLRMCREELGRLRTQLAGMAPPLTREATR